MEQLHQKPLLSIHSLSVEFLQYERGLRRRTTHPVRELSLEIGAGELVAVVGASGSGKSLLAHGILGILPYNAHMSGRIDFDGAELTQMRMEKLRGREICLVPQGVSWLDPLMTVGGQVQNRDALARYGLGEEVERMYPHELSGGMARRVLLATATAKRPRLVIADEPTPGLPLDRARRALGHLKEMAAEGTAVLLITHDVELALEVSDRIAVMYEGTVVETASAQDFSHPERLNHPYARALSRALPQNDFFGGGGV